MKEFSAVSELFDGLANHIRSSDTEGFKIKTSSIGYILERAQVIGHCFGQATSRWLQAGTNFAFSSLDAKNAGRNNNSANVAAAYYNHKGADVYLTRRYIISHSHFVLSEVKLLAYSGEIVAAELFNITFLEQSNQRLERWYSYCKSPHRAIKHLVRLAILNVAMIYKLHVLSRIVELARVYGIDFMSVLTLKSHFKVEE